MLATALVIGFAVYMDYHNIIQRLDMIAQATFRTQPIDLECDDDGIHMYQPGKDSQDPFGAARLQGAITVNGAMDDGQNGVAWQPMDRIDEVGQAKNLNKAPQEISGNIEARGCREY